MEDKKRITFEIIYEIATSYLAKFYVTKKKLREFLNTKIKKLNPENENENEIASLIDSVIEDLENKKYINDDLIAENKINSMLKKGKSLHSIKSNLYNKGLGNNLKKSMQESPLSENEINLLALLNYLEKKNLPPFNREKILDKQEMQKIQQKLILLGFSFNMIESVMYYDLDYANNIKDGLNLKNDK